jgi:hypothetical protein
VKPSSHFSLDSYCCLTSAYCSVRRRSQYRLSDEGTTSAGIDWETDGVRLKSGGLMAERMLRRYGEIGGIPPKYLI